MCDRLPLALVRKCASGVGSLTSGIDAKESRLGSGVRPECDAGVASRPFVHPAHHVHVDPLIVGISSISCRGFEGMSQGYPVQVTTELNQAA